MTRLCNLCSLDFMMPLTTWTFKNYLWFLVVRFQRAGVHLGQSGR